MARSGRDEFSSASEGAIITGCTRFMKTIHPCGSARRGVDLDESNSFLSRMIEWWMA